MNNETTDFTTTVTLTRGALHIITAALTAYRVDTEKYTVTPGDFEGLAEMKALEISMNEVLGDLILRQLKAKYRLTDEA